jgi:glycosyltransferase involved in cell wall biosynthesis
VVTITETKSRVSIAEGSFPRIMNVLVVLSADVDLPHGYTGHVGHVIDTLREAGHRVRVVGYSSTRPRLTDSEAIIPFSGRSTHFNVIRQAARELFGSKVDAAVITSVGATYNVALIALCKLAGVNIIYDCHDPIVESLGISYRDHPAVKALIAFLRFTDFLFDRFAAATFVVSPGMVRMLRARGWRSPLRYFYNTHSGMAFLTGAVTPGGIELPSEDVMVVVYEGGLQKYVRGIEEQLEACAIAIRRGARLMLWLIGHGHPDYFYDLARQLGIEQHVRIDDTVDASTLTAILNRADVAVWNGIVVGMPSKIFDYIAHGIPILSRREDSDVNAICAQFVKIYGDSPEELARELFAAWEHETEERRLKDRRTAAGAEFISRLHRESEANLLGALNEIALAKAAKIHPSKEQ